VTKELIESGPRTAVAVFIGPTGMVFAYGPPELPTSGGSGQTSPASSANAGRPSCSSKTSLDSCGTPTAILTAGQWTTNQKTLWADSEKFSGIWPRAGTLRNGCVYERPMWVPAISGTEFSSWPTPDVAMSNGVRQEDGKRCTGLNTHAEQWLTPKGPSGGGSKDRTTLGGGLRKLEDQAEFWGTPTSRDWKDAAAMWQTPTVPNGGRTMTPEEAAASGATAKGKRTVGLENQAMFWATPRAEDSESTGGHRGTADTLHSQTQAWPTPSAHDANQGGNPNRVGRFGTNHGGRNLADDVMLWGTPTSRDWKDGRASQETLDRNARPMNEAATYWLTPHGMTGTDHTGKAGAGGEFSEQATRWQPSLPAPPPVSGPEFWRRIPILLRLCRQLKKQLPSPYRKVSTLFRRKLNPDFVDWLMGWPVGWSSVDRDFSEAGMASWRSRQRRLMRNCGGE
jgi:hypothetical protein